MSQTIFSIRGLNSHFFCQISCCNVWNVAHILDKKNSHFFQKSTKITQISKKARFVVHLWLNFGKILILKYENNMELLIKKKDNKPTKFLAVEKSENKKRNHYSSKNFPNRTQKMKRGKKTLKKCKTYTQKNICDPPPGLRGLQGGPPQLPPWRTGPGPRPGRWLPCTALQEWPLPFWFELCGSKQGSNSTGEKINFDIWGPWEIARKTKENCSWYLSWAQKWAF